MGIMTSAIHKVLESPLVFEVQQRLCTGNYGTVAAEFADDLVMTGQRILDVGCGTGSSSRAIVDMQANRYIGIDVDPTYVARAAARAPAGDYRVMDGRAMDFAAGTFDLVIVNGVLHHMDDSVAAACMMEVGRVLAPKGRVLVAEPVFTPGWRISTWLLERDRGEFVRTAEGYRLLFGSLAVQRTAYFKFSVHRLCSFVLTPG
ncbi:MAG: methyltransferase domain-containing protein [Actinomycetales bacterium]|nr:methyltransferase domain-containing protein [Actinomycetales bacterium]